LHALRGLWRSAHLHAGVVAALALQPSLRSAVTPCADGFPGAGRAVPGFDRAAGLREMGHCCAWPRDGGRQLRGSVESAARVLSRGFGELADTAATGTCPRRATERASATCVDIDVPGRACGSTTGRRHPTRSDDQRGKP